ncbi:MAG TPA: hypothetical protein DIW47_03665 [Bacteroidetes bacterium]|nr:hypothetical protein [Bacteroidota bacterium]
MKRLLTNLLLLSILITGIEKLYAQTNVPALITSNQVWDISGSPYLINQNTYIDSGIYVKVMPGVQVLAQSNTINLQVDGELQFLGTYDSTILIDQLQIKYYQDAISYDSASGTGAYFKYCVITTPGVGKQVIAINGQSVRIESCTFVNTYYSIYVMSSSQDTPRVDILNCTFNDNTGMMYPMYSGGFSTDIFIIGNTFNNYGKGGGMYVYGRQVTILNNTFNGQNKIFVSARSSNISCNDFINLRSGLELNLYAQDTSSTFIFTHNTLDSTGSTMLNDPMLKVNRLYNLNQSRFNNNNFLTQIGLGVKVLLSGVNPNPTSSESVNFKYNYWVTTDSATIDTAIKDYADDINIFGRADFSGFLSNPDSTCNDSTGSSCHASYYVAIDTNSPFNLYVINNSTGTTSNTSYTWDFGDGYTSNSQNPSHTYNDFGKFYLCVTLYNASENCSSTYCDSIGLDSNGMLLKTGGFTIQVLDESEVNSIKGPDHFEDVRVYPNPTGGVLIIAMDDEGQEPVYVRVIDLAGRVVLETRSTNSGGQNIVIDLSTLGEGLYLLNLQKDQSIYTTKIVVNR